jgi:hypothetical protein
LPQKKAACCSLILDLARWNGVKSCIEPRLQRGTLTGKVKLLDRVRAMLQLKHYSLGTEQSYVDWIKRFIFFHNKRHPESMGADEVRELPYAKPLTPC